VYDEDRQILNDITVDEKYNEKGTYMSTLEKQTIAKTYNNQQCNISCCTKQNIITNTVQT